MDDAERKAMVESLKWVDEVLTDVPYELTPDFLSELFTRHRIDVVVHGDDPCLLPDGTDAYAHAKAQGRFRVRMGSVVLSFFGLFWREKKERKREQGRERGRGKYLKQNYSFFSFSFFCSIHRSSRGRRASPAPTSSAAC